MPETANLVDTIRSAAHPLTGEAADYEPLLDLIGEARVVLLGESTHGTHEFYRERARTWDSSRGRRTARRRCWSASPRITAR